jgi:uncharacterized protein YndB with AHSA1/START domain
MMTGKSPIEPEHRGRKMTAEIRTSASPQQAWEAWADPEKIAQWFTDKAEGKAVAGAVVTWIFERFNYRIPYDVIASEPGERFAIRWNAPAGQNPGILDVRIAREGGETVIRLVNSGFKEGAEWDDEYEGTSSGWQMSLALLRHYLENYFGQNKVQFLVIQPAAFEYAQLMPFFTTRQGIARWFSKPEATGLIGKVGDVISFELQDTIAGVSKLNGRVLAITPREVTLSWIEIGGTLELKAFSMGPAGRMVGVRGFMWNGDAARAGEIERAITPAVARLAELFPKSR